MTPTQPIKPCPWCGNAPDVNDPATFRETDGPKWGAVVCGCGIVGPEVRTGYGDVSHWGPDALAAWNDRADDGTQTALTATEAKLLGHFRRLAALMPQGDPKP